MIRYTQFEAEGFNQARLLNKLTKADITIMQLVRDNAGKMRFYVRTKDNSKAIAIMEKMCYNYKIVCNTNFRALLKRKWWAMACMLLFVALVVASNFFIWRVDIVGIDGITKVNIEKIIADYGIHFMSFKPDDTDSIANSILQLDEVASVRVEMDGNVLEVEVIQSIETTPISQGGAVCSAYDAVVTRIVTESGTPLVSRGDVVERGEPLITGELMATLDGSVTAVTIAKGSVYGDVTFAYHLPICDGIIWTETGNVTTSTTLDVLGLSFGGSEIDYKWYQVVTTITDYFFFKMTQTTYIEVEPAIVDLDIDNYINEKRYELESIYNAQFETKYLIEDSGGVDILRVYFTAELCIGATE